MTATAPPPITTPPAGYSIRRGFAGHSIRRGFMYRVENGALGIISFAYLRDTIGAFKRNDAGEVVFDDAALAADLAKHDWLHDFRLVPDAEMPADMSVLHTEFNPTTRLWQKPNIIDSVRKHHEGDRDFDVKAALFDFHNSQNRARFMRFLRAEATRGLSGAERTAVDARYKAEVDAYNALRSARLEYAFDIVMTEAAIDSLHRVEQDAADVQPSDTADRWHEWAAAQSKALCAEMMRRNALASTHADAIHDDHLADFVAHIAATLTADGALPAGDTGRTWPRAVRFVPALATGDAADATERTLASAMTLIRGKVLPAEGPSGSDDD